MLVVRFQRQNQQFCVVFVQFAPVWFSAPSLSSPCSPKTQSVRPGSYVWVCIHVGVDAACELCDESLPNPGCTLFFALRSNPCDAECRISGDRKWKNGGWQTVKLYIYPQKPPNVHLPPNKMPIKPHPKALFHQSGLFSAEDSFVLF